MISYLNFANIAAINLTISFYFYFCLTMFYYVDIVCVLSKFFHRMLTDFMSYLNVKFNCCFISFFVDILIRF